jgi:hypothetical protein
MLKGQPAAVDLIAQRDQLNELIQHDINTINEQFGGQVVEPLEEQIVEITYPVLDYPAKVRSFNLDKTLEAGGILQGIKGQYLIFDNGVINLRKYTGYHLNVAY